MRLRGRVRTRSGGVLDVRKVLRPVGPVDQADPRVRTVGYRYEALWQPRPGVSIELFRYDNYGQDLSTLHRHDFDADGNETARYPVTHDRMPFMDEVIRETEELARIRTESA
ncbi:MAG: hypothetical protein OXC56_07370 [Chloroflexi bacterium]|nr:hypothetical protein [Chloroflexota bacterium]